MQIIERDELKSDPVFNKLLQLILRNHKTADHTVKNLTENKGIKDFCEEAVHFAKMPPDLFISYKIFSWLVKGRVLVRVESVTIYDDQAEYMVERLKGMKDLSGFVEKN